MCLPVAQMALMAASVLSRAQAANAVSGDQSSAYKAQAQRNKGYQAQADTVMNEEMMPGFTREAQDQALATGQAKRLSESEALAGGGYDLPMSGSSSSAYQSELGKLIADKVTEGRSQAAAATKIGGYQDLGFNNANLLTNSGMKIGQIGSNAQGSSSILPFELQAAQNKGQGWSMLGDLFGGASSIYGMSKLGGGFGKMLFPNTATAAPIIDKSVGPYFDP